MLTNTKSKSLPIVRSSFFAASTRLCETVSHSIGHPRYPNCSRIGRSGCSNWPQRSVLPVLVVKPRVQWKLKVQMLIHPHVPIRRRQLGFRPRVGVRRPRRAPPQAANDIIAASIAKIGTIAFILRRLQIMPRQILHRLIDRHRHQVLLRLIHPMRLGRKVLQLPVRELRERNRRRIRAQRPLRRFLRA